MSLKLLRYISSVALLLALVVVMLGAYTRLTDAGLGCPDWPGCYGHMVLQSVQNVKAWTEMVHRYAAGTLVLLVLAITICVIRYRLHGQRLSLILPLVLVLLIVFQAALGMWTVTLKLLPVVVMGHLLGGMLIFASLCYFRMQISDVKGQDLPRWRLWISLGVVIVFCQIALGGWVSSNYAGIACIGFPRCNGLWFPTWHFSDGFNLFSSVGANYQGGLLDSDSRMTIQVIHRIGACVAAIYVLLLSALLLARMNGGSLRRVAFIAMVLVVVQFTLGIINVVYLLPLWVAVAHNGVAALLLAMMVTMRYLATGGRVNAR